MPNPLNWNFKPFDLELQTFWIDMSNFADREINTFAVNFEIPNRSNRNSKSFALEFQTFWIGNSNLANWNVKTEMSNILVRTSEHQSIRPEIPNLWDWILKPCALLFRIFRTDISNLLNLHFGFQIFCSEIQSRLHWHLKCFELTSRIGFPLYGWGFAGIVWFTMNIFFEKASVPCLSEHGAQNRYNDFHKLALDLT